MPEKTKYSLKRLVEALNRMDEYACDAIEGTTDAEIQQYKDYTLLFDFIEKTKNEKDTNSNIRKPKKRIS